MYYAIADTVS